MSTLWTPSGERPVHHAGSGDTRSPASAGTEPAAESPPTEGLDDELAEEMAEVQRRLAEAPASVVVANHCIGLLQLAALHLDQDQPKLDDASLAIDALAAVVDALGPRLDDNEQPLRDALAQIRLAFVQVKTAQGSG